MDILAKNANCVNRNLSMSMGVICEFIIVLTLSLLHQNEVNNCLVMKT